MFSLCFQKFRRGAERVFISDNLADDSYIFFLSLIGFSFRFFVYWLYPRSRVYETVRCPSVRPSVCLSQHRTTAANPLLARRAGDIDRLLHGRRSAAAMCGGRMRAVPRFSVVKKLNRVARFFRLVAVRLHCWTKPASRVAGLTRVLLMLQH